MPAKRPTSSSHSSPQRKKNRENEDGAVANETLENTENSLEWDSSVDPFKVPRLPKRLLQQRQNNGIPKANVDQGKVTAGVSQGAEASWLVGEVSSEIASWTHQREIRERNKSLRVIYERNGLEYGADVTDPAELTKRTNKAVALRSGHITGVLKKMRAAKSLDLCFLVDVTGSMKEHMTAVKNQIRSIVDKLISTAKASVSSVKSASGIVKKIRLAFVGYRDFDGDDINQFEVLDFTVSVDVFHQFCAKIEPWGGDDDAEDVFGGLEEAGALHWSRDGSTRMLFHIADAPCHGREYHNEPSKSRTAYDRYPKGDPNGRSLRHVLKQLAEKSILYHFGKITDETDKMVEKFSALYADAGGAELTVCNLKDANLLADTIVSTTSIAVAGVGPSRRARLNFVPDGGFDKTMPVWSGLSKFEGRLLAYAMPESIDEVTSGAALKVKKPAMAVIQCASKPFSSGAERLAYYGYDLTVERKPVEIVLKRYTSKTGLINSAALCESAVQVQTIAAYLASVFCSELKEKLGNCYEIRFLKGQVFSYDDPTTGEAQYLTSERRLPDGSEYLRFSNNMEYSMVEQTAQLKGIPIAVVNQLMAFSHWTHKASAGKLMVVDLQGVVDTAEQCIELTDPAIHSTAVTRFGSTNFGSRGMQTFFEWHNCNPVCEAMGLPPPPTTI